MDAVKEIRVRNLRSFALCNDYMPVKNINILVGKNSSGKSTFARVFPLLRQSLEERTKGPVLWFGNYVDFGDFNSSKNKHSVSDEIFFDFKLNLSKSEDFVTIDEDYNVVFNENKMFSDVDVEINLGMRCRETTTSSSSLLFRVGNSEVEILIDEGDVTSFVARNKASSVEVVFDEKYKVVEGHLVPKIYAANSRRKNNFVRYSSLFHEVVKKFSDFLMSFHHSSKGEDSVVKVVKEMPVMQAEEGFNYIVDNFSGFSQFMKNIKGHESDLSEACHMYNLCLHLPSLLDLSSSALKKFFLGVRYLGPVRASAERFYRYQDLQVGEVDHLGSNLPMVVNSLSSIQKDELKNWILENFGFSLEVSGDGSHYALLIKEEDAEDYFNISDMGFGYSQILPIVVSIWLEIQQASDKEDSRRIYNWKMVENESVIVIEQPELHLHPSLQHRFAAAIAKLTSFSSGRNLKFIFETHSQHMIEAFGSAISDDIMKSDDIEITIFEKNDKEGTLVKSSRFDSEGYLVGWPAGFLSS